MGLIQGLHHVTAISGAAQRNLDFYRDVLGLRFVKKTVNFDDPGTYHLYYGDRLGRPGTAMTFFPWPDLPPGRRGAGDVARTHFSVPPASLEWWREHLAAHDRAVEQVERFGEARLHLADPDGLDLALVAVADDPREPWTPQGFDHAVAIRGLHGVTLALADLDATARLLEAQLDLESRGGAAGGLRFAAPGAPAAVVDLEPAAVGPARSGVGSVHHVAFAVADRAAQDAVRRRLVDVGCRVTPVIDRDYFHSIYFKSPGGVLFEVATDGPGFTVDEPEQELGTALRLPAQHEPLRAELERVLPPLA